MYVTDPLAFMYGSLHTHRRRARSVLAQHLRDRAVASCATSDGLLERVEHLPLREQRAAGGGFSLHFVRLWESHKG